MGSVQLLVRGSQQPWISSRTRVGSILKVLNLGWGWAPVSFYLANGWDSAVDLKCHFLGREVALLRENLCFPCLSRKPSCLSLVFRGNPLKWTLSTLVHFSPVTWLLPVMMWWERNVKQKGRQLNLSPHSKPPNRIPTCLAKKMTF